MRTNLKICTYILILITVSLQAIGQSMHFSQYYNAPMLLNPANTALMPDNDYRIGANYRNQWAVIPVPYNTMSAYGDLKVSSNKGTRGNWLGLGASIFSDKAGSGSLSLLQLQGSIAYHLHLSRSMMLSVGGSAAYVQRSINFDDLSFDNQWDGFSFSSRLSNGEKLGIVKTNYYTVGAGGNFSFFPNEAVYIKLGFGVANINQPTESFYGGSNKVGLRPTGNLDMLFRASENIIINPSVYYTTQVGASEIVFGTLSRINMNRDKRAPYESELILGVFDRLGDALVGVIGYQFGAVTFTGSYDFTVSPLAPYNAGYGAMEFSVVFGNSYFRNRGGATKMYTCPRFN